MLVLLASPVRAADRPSACHIQAFEGSNFAVCVFNPRRDTLRLDDTDANHIPLRSFDALSQKLGRSVRRLRFAMNAGMFEDDGRPLGLLLEDGIVTHPANTRTADGNFYLQPNGVFSVDAAGAVHIEPTDHYLASQRPTQWATQSGPMLLIGGALHPAIQPDGPSRLTRNGVGEGDDHTAYFVISQGPVSFGRLARFFRDDLHCRNALFLDGNVSSLWAPVLNRRDQAYPMGPMVSVLDKSR